MKLTRIFATSLIFTSLFGCGPTEVDDKQIQMRNGVAYTPNSTEPYTGTSKSVYENGQTKQSRTWTKGKLVKLNKWYENGFEALSYSSTHIKTLNEQGETMLDAKLLDNKIVSSFELEYQGRRTHYQMQNGVLVSDQSFDDGELISESEYKNGFISKYTSNMEYVLDSGKKCTRNDLRVFGEPKTETYFLERSFYFGCDDEVQDNISLSEDGTEIINSSREFNIGDMKWEMVESKKENKVTIARTAQPFQLIENDSTLFLMEQHWFTGQKIYFVEDIENSITLDYSKDGERLTYVQANLFGYRYIMYESDLKSLPNIEPNKYGYCEINEKDIEGNALCIEHLKAHAIPLLKRLDLTSRKKS